MVQKTWNTAYRGTAEEAHSLMRTLSGWHSQLVHWVAPLLPDLLSGRRSPGKNEGIWALSTGRHRGRGEVPTAHVGWQQKCRGTGHCLRWTLCRRDGFWVGSRRLRAESEPESGGYSVNREEVNKALMLCRCKHFLLKKKNYLFRCARS